MEGFKVKEKALAVSAALILPLLFPEAASAKDYTIYDCRQHFVKGDKCLAMSAFCDHIPNLDEVARAKSDADVLKAQRKLLRGECNLSASVVDPQKDVRRIKTARGVTIHVIEVDKYNCEPVEINGVVKARCEDVPPLHQYITAPQGISLKFNGTSQIT